MSVDVVYSSPSNDVASVSGFAHGFVVMAPACANGLGVTLHIHWTVAEAREAAALLIAAADAVVEAEGHPAEDAAEGLAAMERAK